MARNIVLVFSAISARAALAECLSRHCTTEDGDSSFLQVQGGSRTEIANEAAFSNVGQIDTVANETIKVNETGMTNRTGIMAGVVAEGGNKWYMDDYFDHSDFPSKMDMGEKREKIYVDQRRQAEWRWMHRHDGEHFDDYENDDLYFHRMQAKMREDRRHRMQFASGGDNDYDDFRHDQQDSMKYQHYRNMQHMRHRHQERIEAHRRALRRMHMRMHHGGEDDYYSYSADVFDHNLRRHRAERARRFEMERSRMQHRHADFPGEDMIRVADAAEDHMDDIEEHAFRRAAGVADTAHEDAADIRDDAAEDADHEGNHVIDVAEHVGRRSIDHARHAAEATVEEAKREAAAVDRRAYMRQAHQQHVGSRERELVETVERVVDAVKEARADAHEAAAAKHMAQRRNKILQKKADHAEHVVRRMESETMGNAIDQAESKLDNAQDEADDIKDRAYEDAKHETAAAMATAEHIMEHARDADEHASEEVADLRAEVAEEALDVKEAVAEAGERMAEEDGVPSKSAARWR